MDILSDQFIISTITGLIISGLINLTGVGGGVMIIPSLVLLTNMPISVAIGTASWFSTITKVASSINHIINKTVSWKPTMIFLTGAIPATMATAIFVVTVLNKYPEQAEILQEILRYSVIIIMIVSTILIYVGRNKQSDLKKTHLSKLGIITSSIFIGFIMALTGVGGGILIIPALKYFTNEKMKNIVSCSIVIAVILSLITGSIYAQGGQINTEVLVGLLLGAAAGVPLSNIISKKISNEKLTNLIIVLIILSAIMMILSPYIIS